MPNPHKDRSKNKHIQEVKKPPEKPPEERSIKELREKPKTSKANQRSWQSLYPAPSQWLLDATNTMNFAQMTPVQASTIPLFMSHKDVVVEAVTGSGKTLAFLIPIIHKLLTLGEPQKKHHVEAIIISPTRELARQIHKVLLSLLAFHGPSSAAINSLKASAADEESDVATEEKVQIESYPLYTRKIIPQLLLGGSNTAAHDLSTFLKTSPNVLIATPGRLLEVLSSPYVHAPQSSFEMLVLDEADRLLDLGFRDDLTKILALLPKQRRTGLFSASVSEAVDQLIRVGLRNPVRISVKVKGKNGVQDGITPASLSMTYLITPASQKLPALSQLLHKLAPIPFRTIVFLSTCAAVDYFQHLLPLILPPGMVLVPLHGKHQTHVRKKNFALFTENVSPSVLLTTDIAARGLDIDAVDLVVQIDPPADPKVFIHRCGRAGRAGRKGLSVIFLQPGKEEDYIPFLEVRKTPISKLEIPAIDVTSEDADQTTATFRSKVLEDRALHAKAQKAFVSWVRSYHKHEVRSMFKIADLDWTDLAAAWALLVMPTMPELKRYDRGSFRAPEVDWDNYRFKDKQREKLRKEALTAQPETDDKSNKKKDKPKGASSAWSQKIAIKSAQEARREQRRARKAAHREKQSSEAQRNYGAETQRMIEQVKKQQSQQERQGKKETFK